MNQEPTIKIHVYDTNAEAMIAKISAIKKKYFDDPFAEEFVKGNNEKKDVIIHRGYWCRVHIFSRIVEEFLKQHAYSQIISLGCGYDTLPFQLISKFKEKNFKFIEIDLPIVVKKKIAKINNSQILLSLLDDATIQTDKIQSKKYSIWGQDLSAVDEFISQIQSLDKYAPTFIFAECVLTYIEVQFTNKLLRELSTNFGELTFMNYEMFNPQDGFGKMMVKNFEYRGCPLVGISAYPTLESQQLRLKELGFPNVQIADMKTIYLKGTQIQERKRIEQIEFMDEWEEWNIMQSHYFVSLAFNNEKVNLQLLLA